MKFVRGRGYYIVYQVKQIDMDRSCEWDGSGKEGIQHIL